MGRKKQLIIPVFLPFAGCLHQCVFCDQFGITGADAQPDAGAVRRTIDEHLASWKGAGTKEIAFYGGSFTALTPESQKAYLEIAFEYVLSGVIDSIRLSTRPDCVRIDSCSFLMSYGVRTVELGAQSMSDTVLRLSGRGHNVDDTRRAVKVLRDSGLNVGLQLMPGLPGDTRMTIITTADEAARLRPDFVRIYPVLVLKGTPLYRMYRSGLYAPWPLIEMVDICRGISAVFREAKIPVIRMGLQPTAELEKSLVAGPYHPSFRSLVERDMDRG